MYKYVLIAFLAAGLIWLGSFGEKKLAGKTGRIAMIASYVVVALGFCVLAGIRSISTGTDVEMYVTPSFEWALQVDLSTFFTEGIYARWMPLSKLLFWAVPNLTHSLFWMLFIIHLVIVVPMLATLRLLLKDNAWFGVLVFGIAFYPMSMNTMRQFMGMGFILVSYVFARKRKPLPFLLFILIAVLLHQTCLLGLLVYPVWLFSSGQLNRIRINPAVLGLASMAVVQTFIPGLKAIAPYLGYFGSYINGPFAEAGGNGTTELRYIVFICAVLGILYLVFTRKHKVDLPVRGELSGLAAVVFFGVAVFSACLYSFQLFRLGVFFLYFAVLLIPMACESIRPTRRKAQFAIVVIALLMLFAQAYYGNGSHEAVPYVIDLTDKF